MSSDLSPKRSLRDTDTPKELGTPAESHFHAIGDVAIECTGYSRIGNLLAVTISIPSWIPSAGNRCLPDSALACGFYLQHPQIGWIGPSYPRPPFLPLDVLFVGSATIQVHSTAPVQGPLGYQISLPLDTLHESNGFPTLEVIERLIHECMDPVRTARLHAVVAYEDSIGSENWGGHGIHTFWKAVCDIELPLKPIDNGSIETAAYWGKTELLPYLAEAHAIHAALLPNGSVLYFSGARVGDSSRIIVDEDGLEMLFQRPEAVNDLQREHWIRLHHLYQDSSAKLFDPYTNTVSTVPMPGHPSIELIYYEPQVNSNKIPDVFERNPGGGIALANEDGTKIQISSDTEIDPTAAIDYFATDRTDPTLKNYPLFYSYTPDLFCTGHCLTSNGKLLIAGGTYKGYTYQAHGHHRKHQKAIRLVALYDPESNTWESITPPMLHGRWYPALVMLGDGSVVIAGGHTDQWDQSQAPLTEEEIEKFSDYLGNPGDEDLLKKLLDQIVKKRHENTDLEIFSPVTRGWRRVRDGFSSYHTDPFFDYYPEVYPHLLLMPDGTVFSSTPIGSVPTDVPGVRRSLLPDGVRGHATGLWDPATDQWYRLNDQKVNESTTVLLPLMPGTDTEEGYVPTVMATGKSESDKEAPGGPKSIVWFISPRIPDINEEIKWTEQLIPFQGHFDSAKRVHGYGVLLADGTIALIGGRSEGTEIASGRTGSDQAARNDIEIYNPFVGSRYVGANGTWHHGGEIRVPRNYHSAMLLLPDGRVWIAGSNFDGVAGPLSHYEMELYSPGYLFRGPRPVIECSQEEAAYGQEIVVTLRDGWRRKDIDLDRLGLIKMSTSTHSFNGDQRYVGLAAAARQPDDEHELLLLAPPNGNIAPPGYYMLFLLSARTGAPSEAEIIRIGGG